MRSRETEERVMTKASLLIVIASVLLVATSARAYPVPELDPGSASLGATLLIGGLLVLNGRRRKR
jgi:hypothetical protein